MSRFLIGLLSAACWSVGQASAQPAIDLAKQKVAEGFEAYGRAHYASAVELFSEAIALNPGDEDHYLYRGDAYLELRALDLARADYARVIALAPDRQIGYRKRCIAYYWLGAFDKAKPDCDRAVEIGGASVNYTWRGWVLMGLGDHGGALEDFRRVVELTAGSHAAVADVCAALVRLGRLEESVVACNKAIAMGNRWTAYYWRGQAFQAMGDLELASESYQRALRSGRLSDDWREDAERRLAALSRLIEGGGEGRAE